MKNRVTLSDVARMAGVSPSIVSYVINGKKTVRKETYERIQKAIEELDYHPNLQASSLKTNCSMNVGVIVSDLNNLFFVDMLRGLEKELFKKNYYALLCNSNNDVSIENQHLKRLASRQIDGLILMGIGQSDYTELKKMRIPILSIDRYINDKIPFIHTDNYAGGKMATEYILSKGRKRILYIGWGKHSFSIERYEGYVAAMKEHGQEAEIRSIYVLENGDFEKQLKENLPPTAEFDACYCCNDYIALALQNVLLGQGIRIPDDVAVVGYDDIAPASTSSPKLTTVSQPTYQMGKLSADIIVKMIQGETIENPDILLKTELVLRESC